MDKELIAYLDRKFEDNTRRILEETGRQIQSLRRETLERFEQVDQRFEQVDAEIRGTRILVEDVRSELRGVAEGVASNTERLEQLREEFKGELHDLRSEMRLAHRRFEQRENEHEARLDALEAASG